MFFDEPGNVFSSVILKCKTFGLFLFAIQISAFSFAFNSSSEIVSSCPKTFTTVTPRILPGDVLANKMDIMLGPLGEKLAKKMQYRSSSSKKGLTKIIENKEVDLIVWGFIEELDKLLKENGFAILLQSRLDVGMYQRIHSGKSEKDKNIVIGGLHYTAAVKAAESYFSKKNEKVTLKGYPDYFEAIKDLDDGLIDYIVAPPSFYKAMKPSIQSHYKKTLTIPSEGFVTVYIKKTNCLINLEQSISDYFVVNTELFNQVFSVIGFKPVSEN